MVPKSSGVATIPSPKWCCQIRLTSTRAVRGLSLLAIARARSSRPLPVRNGFRSASGPDPDRQARNRRGATAPQAAGEIHTDFERGFIRAETIAYDDFIACGGEAGAKEAGQMRSEGKDYVVQDGDVLLFRFNV